MYNGTAAIVVDAGDQERSAGQPAPNGQIGFGALKRG